MSRKGFVPHSRKNQLAGIGLSANAQEVGDTDAYECIRSKKRQLPEFWDALRLCLDPSGGEWEDIDPPEDSEWLDSMLDKTPDQSFRSYVSSRPNRPDKSRNVLYLLPLCDPRDLEAPAFPEGPWPSWRALEAVTERFFAPMIVRTLPAVPMQQLKPRPGSRSGSWGVEQYNAATALDALEGLVPRDAYGLMAVTMCDLYPKPEWNFVYGLARLTKRVGIFSFCRHTPTHEASHSEAWLGAQLLHRSMKTLLHEIGHMFGMKHCTWYNCLMRGSNGEGVEHQINHLYLCPACLRKLHWCIGFDIRERYAGLLEIYQEYGDVHQLFEQDCVFMRSRLEKLQSLPDGITMISESRAVNRNIVAGRSMCQPEGVNRNIVMEKSMCPPTPPVPVDTRSVGRAVRGGDGRRSPATSIPSITRNRMRPAYPSSLQAQDPDCPCCEPGKENSLGLKKSFGAGRLRKQLDEAHGPGGAGMVSATYRIS